MRNPKFTRLSALMLALLMVFSLVALSGCGKSDQAKPKRDYILIGRVNPATGPLAGFGVGTPYIEEQAIEAINKDGGIYIAEYGKKVPIKLITVDSESNPTKASEAANKLILQDKVDLIISASTVDTVNPVSAAAERHKIPCISVDAPGEAWLSGGPYKWSFHAFWKSSSQADVYIDTWDLLATNKKVGILAPNDPEGMALSQVIKEKAAARGYTVVDPGRFPMGTKDYTAIVNQFKNEGVDIIVGVMITPDFATAWKQFHQQGYVPKVVTMAKALLFPTDVAALGGDLGVGLTTEVWWTPMNPYKSSLTGQTSAELAKSWTEALGNKQPTSPMGYKHALMEITIDVLKRAQSLDREKLREAIKATNLDTLVGHIQYDNQNFSETKLVAGQWKKGTAWPWDTIVVSNKKAPEIPLSSEPMFYIPGSK
ncbi:MAG: urea transporter, urea binding protein [Firmicutes bacterium]|nr:urea transporter, urea binding protein [Bacillota bacterium]